MASTTEGSLSRRPASPLSTWSGGILSFIGTKKRFQPHINRTLEVMATSASACLRASDAIFWHTSGAPVSQCKDAEAPVTIHFENPNVRCTRCSSMSAIRKSPASQNNMLDC